REQGVLLMSSGFMTHGLPFLTQAQFQFNEIPAWSSAFDQWAAEALAAGNVEELARFGSIPTVRFAHPTVEHFTPLFVTLGAASDLDAGVETTIEGYQFGLSKRSFQVA
ncbi:MAG: dioxygenase, partial [Actinomycetota bacterium]